MNRSGLIKTCVALLLSALVTACSHTPPGASDAGPHEMVRIVAKSGSLNSHTAGLEVVNALDAWRRKHGQFPSSLLELSPRHYGITPVPKDDFRGTQTLIHYRRPGATDCKIVVKDYIEHGGLLGIQELNCRSGAWTRGRTENYKFAPRLP